MDKLRPIPGFPGYCVTSDGDVWTFWEQVSPGGHRNGFQTALRDHPVKQLAPHPRKNGAHPFVRIRADIGGRPTNVPIHRAVLLAWVGPPPPGKPLALHRNDDSWDNRVENLYWGNLHDNEDDRRTNGGRARAGPPRKLSDDDLRAIRTADCPNRGDKGRLAERYGVSRYTVWAIRKGTYVRRV